MKKLDLLKPGHARAGQLTTLAREINEGQDTIAMLEKQAMDKGAEFLCEVSLQGQRLLKIKELVGHGRWMEWLRANCPLISQSTANAYMRYASNSQRAVNLGATSLREALRLCSADDASANGNGNGEHVPRSWPPYIEALGRFGKFLGLIERNPLDRWPKEGREKLKGDLLPLASELWPEKFV